MYALVCARASLDVSVPGRMYVLKVQRDEMVPRVQYQKFGANLK